MKATKCLFDENKHTPEGMVSVSQLQSFMSCGKKWEYGYVDCITPRVERPYLSVGKLCHKGMQLAMEYVWRNSGSPSYSKIEALRQAIDGMEIEWSKYIEDNNFLQEELIEQDQVLADAESVFVQAFYEFDIDRYEVLTVKKHGVLIPALELHFVVPCPGSKGLHGYIDAILKDKTTGFVWCADYKFRKSLSPDDEEAVNVQNAVYVYACKKMGVEVTGTMTWQHCNTPAADPQLLKSGGVSKSKIKTTWERYEHFCRSHGIDPEPYREEMQEKLADIEWYRATYEYRNTEFINNVWNTIIVPFAYAIKKSYKMAEKTNGNKRSLYPWNCKMCQYQPLCQAELRGYDAQAIILRDYVTRSHTR